MKFSRIPVELFYSYSHKDEELRYELENHLALLKREGIIKVWHDREIGVGTDWVGEIDEHLNTADIILLLISSNFLASDYCYDLEVKRALERHEAGTACVIPVVLRPCDWMSAPFGKIQALPKNANPVSRWNDRDEAFLDVVTGIRLLIQGSLNANENQQFQLKIDPEFQPLEEISKSLNITSANNGKQIDIGNSNRSFLELNGLDFKSLAPIEILSRTEHSIIEKYFVHETYYVLKKTRRDYCQFETLKKLVGKVYKGYERSVSVTYATPLMVGMTDEYVWEIHPFYKGISLLELIRKNRKGIQGDFLGAFHNSLFEALSGLHKDKILHRDISPSNIFMVGADTFLILDCSFCCDEQLPQIPVGNSSYTAPEQRVGKASFLSDWYSIAATIYFLANGYPPNRREERQFKDGLENLDISGYKPSNDFTPRDERPLGIDRTIPKLYESLLDPQALNRPNSIWEVILDEITLVTSFSEITSILDLGELGYLIIQKYNFVFVSNNEIHSFLHEAIRIGAVKSPEVQKFIAMILTS